MSKFLPIGTKGELLNSDMIARIIPRKMADASSSPKMVSTSTARSTFTTKSMTTTPFVPSSLARASALSIWMMMATAKSAPALL